MSYLLFLYIYVYIYIYYISIFISILYLSLSKYTCIYIYIHIYIYIYIVIVCHHEITQTSYGICRYKIYVKLYDPFLLIWCNFLKARQPLQGDNLLFTRNSWYSFDQYRKDERLRWPWNYPMVLDLCVNLVITKYKLKSQIKLSQLWPLTMKCSEYVLRLIWHTYQKYVSSAHI